MSTVSASDPVISLPAPSARAARSAPRKNWVERLDEFISRLSTRNTFWSRVCSFIWLPYAFFSGIKMRLMGTHDAHVAVLPFTRFNRNWYNAMAGAALLGNSEIAGGMYVFGIVGAEYTVVCKHLEYKFMRPCLGPALYHIEPRGEIKPLVEKGGEFNVTLDLDICQQALKTGDTEKRVGKCAVTFHVTPKEFHKTRAARRATK